MKKIPLTQGAEAIVDDEDYVALSRYRWYLNQGYAVRNVTVGKGKQRSERMHRVILGAKPGEMVDHANRNRLDNRRANLRLCTRSENAFNQARMVTNSSGYKGVRLHMSGKWEARVRQRHVGLFDSKEEAAAAYAEAVRRVAGEFARAG